MTVIPIHKTGTYKLKRKGKLWRECLLYKNDLLHIDEKKTKLVING